MMNRRLLGLAVTLAGLATFAAIAVPRLSADAATGALANFTPGRVKLLETGGTQPNGQYADLGRLKLPVGSWVITAHTVLLASASTGVDCFLVAPNAIAHTPLEISSAKNENIKDLSATVVTTAPNGGNADLLCRVASKAADRKVLAQDTSLVAVSVSGATVTNNPAPAVGTY
jgi:hypothetical protein